MVERWGVGYLTQRLSRRGMSPCTISPIYFHRSRKYRRYVSSLVGLARDLFKLAMRDKKKGRREKIEKKQESILLDLFLSIQEFLVLVVGASRKSPEKNEN